MKVSEKQINLILLLSIAVAVLLRVTNLDSREFWYDEVLSLLLSTGQKVNYKAPPDVPILLANYTELYEFLMWLGLGVGVFRILISPLLKKAMHGVH